VVYLDSREDAIPRVEYDPESGEGVVYYGLWRFEKRKKRCWIILHCRSLINRCTVIGQSERIPQVARLRECDPKNIYVILAGMMWNDDARKEAEERGFGIICQSEGGKFKVELEPTV